jgi:hypothetical protein
MAADLLQILIYLALIGAATPLLGSFMARVFAGERTLLSPVLAPLERAIYGVCGIDPGRDQHWTHYALALLATNAVAWMLLYAILRLQHLFPLNPEGLPPMAPDLAFNTAVSFVTNTNWQAYGGETTLSYFSQMVGLTVQNFVSALNRFVQNLLDMTRFGYGALQPNREWVDLREIAGRALRQMSRPLAPFEVEMQIPDDLPILHVDPILIEQVVVNILDNAAKYSRAGGRIEIGAAPDGERVRVGVSDQYGAARRSYAAASATAMP